MSVIDAEAPIRIPAPPGPYAAYVASCNVGVDQSTLGEDRELTDWQLAQRKDLEWYRIYFVPGVAPDVGFLKGKTY
ncbi:MAG: hypothetical protein AAGI08_18715 [Bacteroidota bacterium]